MGSRGAKNQWQGNIKKNSSTFSKNNCTLPPDSAWRKRLHKCDCHPRPWGAQEVSFLYIPTPDNLFTFLLRMVIACHYDSLLKPEGFLGATDSAVPCAQWEKITHHEIKDSCVCVEYFDHSTSCKWSWSEKFKKPPGCSTWPTQWAENWKIRNHR